MITTNRNGEKLYYGLTWDKYYSLDKPARKAYVQKHLQQQEADRLRRSKAYAAKVDAERKAREAEVEADRQAEHRAKVEAKLRRSYLLAGGSAEEFEAIRDRVVADHLEAEASAQIEQTTASVNRALRSNF